jgi:hypothetical protein
MECVTECRNWSKSDERVEVRKERKGKERRPRRKSVLSQVRHEDKQLEGAADTNFKRPLPRHHIVPNVVVLATSVCQITFFASERAVSLY